MAFMFEPLRARSRISEHLSSDLLIRIVCACSETRNVINPIKTTKIKMQKNGISLASRLGFVARNEYQCAHENRIKNGFSVFSKFHLDLKKNKEIQIDFHFHFIVSY